MLFVVLTHIFILCYHSDPEKAKRLAREQDEADIEAIKQDPEVQKIIQMGDLTEELIADLNRHWEDTAVTTEMWQIVNDGDARILERVISQAPPLAHVRSKDGRGPMWWAHESGNKEVVAVLKKMGVRDDLEDATGLTPLDISKIK
jgi:dolichyl-diphosphooligosaccharide--protein glycosyltransferase